MGTADRLSRFGLGGAALLAVALGSPHARAADDAPPPQFSEEPPSRWYGWQTLATDGVAVGLFSASLATVDNSGRNSPSSALAWGALGAYALGAPIMHFVHENPGRGFASFGMRIGGPVVLGFTGAMLENCRGGRDFCGLGGALIGTSLGIIGAIAVDAAVFAYDDKPPENEAALRSFRIGLSPRGVVAFGNF